MKKLILAFALAVGLSGCAQITTAYNAITGATVSPGAVIVAGYSVDALETAATRYLERPRCGTLGIVICRSPIATKAIDPAVKSMRLARDNAEKFLADHPGQLGSTGTYDALQAAAKTLKGVLDQYAIGIGG